LYHDNENMIISIFWEETLYNFEGNLYGSFLLSKLVIFLPSSIDTLPRVILIHHKCIPLVQQAWGC